MHMLIHGIPVLSFSLSPLLRPQARLRQFTEEFSVDAGGITIPLLTLTGACLGTELKLASGKGGMHWDTLSLGEGSNPPLS